MLRTSRLNAGVSRVVALGVSGSGAKAPPTVLTCRFCSSKLKEQAADPEQAKMERAARDEEKLQRVIENIKLRRMNLERVIQDPKDDRSTPPPASNPVHREFISHSRTMARKKAAEVAKLFKKKGASGNSTANELHELLESALPVKDQFSREDSITDIIEKSEEKGADVSSEWRKGYDEFQARHPSGDKEMSFADMIKKYEAINEMKRKAEAERKVTEEENKLRESNVASVEEVAEQSPKRTSDAKLDSVEGNENVGENEIAENLNLGKISEVLTTDHPSSEVSKEEKTPSISQEDKQKFSDLLKLNSSSFYDMSREHMKEDSDSNESMLDLLRASAPAVEKYDDLENLLKRGSRNTRSEASDVRSTRTWNPASPGNNSNPTASGIVDEVQEDQPKGRGRGRSTNNRDKKIEMEDVFAKIKRKRARTEGSTESFIKLAQGKELTPPPSKEKDSSHMNEVLQSAYKSWTGYQEVSLDPESEESLLELLSKMETATSSKSSIDREAAFQSEGLEDKADKAEKIGQPKRSWPTIQVVEGNTESMREFLFGSNRLHAFSLRDLEPTEALKPSQEPHLSTWDMLHHMETNKVLAPKEENGFDEMVRLTNEGKLWSFPIDNEQGLGAESQVPFYDHIFLDRFCQEFPQHEKVQEFMQVVCLGLSKNPYMPLKKKLAHIERLKVYFEDKMELLETASNIEDEMTIFTD